jgi:hypothetical protein
MGYSWKHENIKVEDLFREDPCRSILVDLKKLCP